MVLFPNFVTFSYFLFGKIKQNWVIGHLSIPPENMEEKSKKEKEREAAFSANVKGYPFPLRSWKPYKA